MASATVEARVRAMNPTMRRIHLLEHGWSKGRNDKSWWSPVHGGPYTVARAIRMQLDGESL